jgi:hypothetical protein
MTITKGVVQVSIPGHNSWIEAITGDTEEQCRQWIKKHDEEARLNYINWEYRIILYVEP